MIDNKLESARVEEIFRDCLFRNSEDTSAALIVEGAVMTAGFHPGRIEGHKEDVCELLSQLPVQFHANTGGGWSLLNACMTRDDEQWTGDQALVDRLFMLGMALELAVCLLPREMWPALPGGVPYYMVVGCEHKVNSGD